ncbi:MAG: hypothetical protein C0624_07360 [Desulfuromonas sp.]|nr:MAG: hypothetical protein C0624_07360 [Desulfuromonas sp.]
MPGEHLKLRILVIDDEPCIRETYQWYLEEQGHEVVTVPDPSHYRCDGTHPYPCGDLFLVDFSMPRVSGLDFIEQMQANGCKCATENKFIVSGNIDAVDKERVKQLGCQLLQKPLTFADLDTILQTIQSRTPQERQLSPLDELQKRIA